MQGIEKFEIDSYNNNELASVWLCLVGYKVLSTNHNNQKESTVNDGKACYLCKNGFSNKL